MSNAQELRIQLYRDLEAIYHRFFDELAESGLPDGEAARLTQKVLLSRQEGFKHLVSVDEMESVATIQDGE